MTRRIFTGPRWLSLRSESLSSGFWPSRTLINGKDHRHHWHAGHQRPRVRLSEGRAGTLIPVSAAHEKKAWLAASTAASTRSRIIAVGERTDEEIRRDIAENRKTDKPAKHMIIGIDGAFVKGRRPTGNASLEIITGWIEADAEPSKMFAIVRDQDGRAKQDVDRLVHHSIILEFEGESHRAKSHKAQRTKP
jgi:hypothetical protein